MTQFHEGQDVEVALMTSAGRNGKTFAWRKAKIVGSTGQSHTEYMVDFPDGSRAVFDAAHIRPIVPTVTEHMEQAHRTWPTEQFD